MTKELLTYREVGEYEGLSGKDLERYCTYMDTRWHDSEAIECAIGHAQEWAQRFLAGREYEYSGPDGVKILEKIDR